MIIDYGLGDFVKKVTRFDGTSITNAYDVAGRKSVDAYLNASDQLLETVNYQYYLDGELKSVSDSTSTIANGYDHLNRLTASTSSVASVVSVVDYKYDPVGNLTNSVVSVAGSQVAEVKYEFDEAERLETITSSDAGIFEYDYNPTNGCIAEISNSVSGITTSYLYDIMDRVTNISYSASNGSLIRSIEYAYNAAGMITNKTILGGSNPQALWYRYDSLDRLSEEASDLWAARLGYQYDLAGNMTNLFYMTGSCDPSCYDANKNSLCDYCNRYCLDYESTLGNGNRLISWLGPFGGPASYDSAGNTTNMDQSSTVKMNLEWDERYRLISADSSVFSVSYDYDASGRRVSHTDSGFTTYFIYDGNHVVADTLSSGFVLRTYTYGPGVDNILSMTVYETTGPHTYYYLKDHQNSVIALADESGAVVESYEYSAWGQLLYVRNATGISIGVSAYGNRYLFQGREYDWKTKLYYFRARWYCPESGRWLSKDPIGISGGLNQYVFCGNNPVNFVDPMGLRWLGGADDGIQVGRAGTIISDEPGKQGEWIEGHVPAMETMGYIHDDLVGGLTGVGVPDVVANIPTMLPCYGAALITETVKTPGYLFGALKGLFDKDKGSGCK